MHGMTIPEGKVTCTRGHRDDEGRGGVGGAFCQLEAGFIFLK